VRRATVNTRALLWTAIVVLVIAVAGVAYRPWVDGTPPFGPTDDQWTAVFLTNGQAYFGHFYSGPGEYARLREVYYVLATQLQSQDPKVPSATRLSLQKLGSELYGPTREMEISKRQILFTEALRPDSPVVRSIQELKGGGGGPQLPPATTVPATATPAGSPGRSASPSPTR